MKKRTLTLTLTLMAVCFLGIQSFAQQTVNMPLNNGPQSFTATAGACPAFNFFDNGGPAGVYANNSGTNSVVTFAPATAGNKIRVTFTQFQCEANFDALYVWDGPSTASPNIPGAGAVIFPVFAGGPWNGATAPNNVGPNIVQATAGNASGALTFGFSSDASVQQAGWQSTIVEVPSGACAMTAPANIVTSTDPGICAANVTTPVPAFSPGGCQADFNLLYSVNNGPFIDLGVNASGNVVLTNIPPGANVITWQLASIVCGDPIVVSSVTQNITVNDEVPPTIDCPSSFTVNLSPGECCQFVTWPEPVIDDNCPLLGVGPAMVLEQDPPQTNFWTGYMNNLTNLTAGTLQISQVEVRASTLIGAGTYNIRVFMKTGSFVGFENNAAAWTLVGEVNAPLNSFLPGNLVDIPFSAPFDIAPGDDAGIYVVCNNGTSVRVFASLQNTPTDDGFLRINNNPGRWISGFFGGVIFPGENPWPDIDITYNTLTQAGSEQIFGPAPGSELCIEDSPYEIGYQVTDAQGNTATCSFTVSVNEFPNAISTLICNDQVNISLDSTCTVIVNADQVLEGGPYGCYDNYLVQVDKIAPFGNGPWVPAVLGPSDIGKNYAVRVVDPATGNSCWGMIKVEDKIAPNLSCPDAFATCGDDLTPCASAGGFGTAMDLEQNVNFTNFWTGYMTNLENKVAQPMQISMVNVQASLAGAPAGNYTLSAYMKVGTFQGFENNAAAWTLVGEVDANVTAGFPTVLLFDIPFSTPFVIPPGEIAGLYIVANNGAGTTVRVVAELLTSDEEDDNLRIVNSTPGQWVNGLFGGVAFPNETPKPQLIVSYALLGDAPCLPNDLELNVNAFLTGPNTYRANIGAGDPVLETCSDVTLTYSDTEQSQPCGGTLDRIVSRKWTASDASGNTSTCIQTINVAKPSLGAVQVPPSYDDVDQPALECNGQFPTPQVLESLDLQGFPYFNDKPIACGLSIDFEDNIIDVCDGTYKVRREWVLLDWCTGEDIEYVQLIKVKDDQGPDIACPANLTVSTDPFTCCATVDLPDVIVSDVCSRINNVTAMIIGIDPTTFDTIGMFNVGSSLTSFPGNSPKDPDTLAQVGSTPCLPLGTHTVIYTVEDDCGNTSSCEFRLTVRDFTPPVAACDEFTVVSIGLDDPFDCYLPSDDGCQFAGVTWIKATTFDDGSYDNCGDVRFRVQRMQPYSDCILGLNPINGMPECDPLIDPFPDFPSEFERAISEGDSIKFYCCEVGTSQMIILRIYQVDINGNITVGPDGSPVVNECMVEVEVQDKLKPVCQAPANVTVSCENFDPSFWAYGNASVFDLLP
jgi:hypothetical protein